MARRPAVGDVDVDLRRNEALVAEELSNTAKDFFSLPQSAALSPTYHSHTHDSPAALPQQSQNIARENLLGFVAGQVEQSEFLHLDALIDEGAVGAENQFVGGNFASGLLQELEEHDGGCFEIKIGQRLGRFDRA